MTEIVCCEMCGRDTVNKSRVCRTCMAGISRHNVEKDRDVSAWDFAEDVPDDVDLLVERAMLDGTE